MRTMSTSSGMHDSTLPRLPQKKGSDAKARDTVKALSMAGRSESFKNMVTPATKPRRSKEVATISSLQKAAQAKRARAGSKLRDVVAKQAETDRSAKKARKPSGAARKQLISSKWDRIQVEVMGGRYTSSLDGPVGSKSIPTFEPIFNTLAATANSPG
jgi:hypothetical protein